MKKYFVLAIFLFLADQAIATNFYGGVNLGVNAVKINKNLYYPVEEHPTSKFKFNPSYNNFHSQLFLGTEFTGFAPFNLALQADADFYTGNTKNVISYWFLNTSAIASEKLKYGFGLFALPEYQLSDRATVFAGPGVVFSQFSVASGYTAGNLGVSGNFSKWLTGWALKLGSINQLSDNIDLLLTYQYAAFDSVHRTNVEPLSTNLLHAGYRPYTNLFSLGLRYVVGRKLVVYK